MPINNKCSFTGNLTRDPEYKTISERELVTFRIAVNEPVGNGKEETVYMDVDAWGNHANYARGVDLVKGDRVVVEGRLRQRSWEDSNGTKRVNYSVVPTTVSKTYRPPRREGSTANNSGSAGGNDGGSGFDTF